MRSVLIVLLAVLFSGAAAVEASAQLRTSVVATGLTNPVAFVADPTDPTTFFVVEQRGTIRSITNGVVSPV
ncbi:MAG: hypothetical protein Q8N52_07630, partial [Acidobacteriota bacterium]|nr:hypothetical protein [Acidobacteriota bacterium]